MQRAVGGPMMEQRDGERIPMQLVLDDEISCEG